MTNGNLCEWLIHDDEFDKVVLECSKGKAQDKLALNLHRTLIASVDASIAPFSPRAAPRSMVQQAVNIKQWAGSSSVLQRRKSSLAAEQRMKTMAEQHADGCSSDDEKEEGPSSLQFKARPIEGTKRDRANKRQAKRMNEAEGEDYQQQSSEEDVIEHADEAIKSVDDKFRKRQKTSRTERKPAFTFVIDGVTSAKPCVPPMRLHGLSYHRPLMLDPVSGKEHRLALLKWFDSVATSRQMPWRKSWINPAHFEDAGKLRTTLEKRAYEVWISEIMLQQTRVAVVIDYWNRWTAKWPTIQDLANAEPDEVLSAWRGLGYYSRATRIHEAAKKVAGDEKMQGLLPANATDLEAKVPGVGRYTAGAISSIVFGHASPMVDGNVLRVLARQLGLYANVKSDKAVIDVLWLAADKLVKAVARDAPDISAAAAKVDVCSDRPGRWGQALMELGSTVCTPKPDCAACPVQKSCRAFAEGSILALKRGQESGEVPADIEDIEDTCTLCEPFGDIENDDNASHARPTRPAKSASSSTRKQATLSSFAFSQKKDDSSHGAVPEQGERRDGALRSAAMETVANYTKHFPLKVAKKAVRQEETLVCAIMRKSDGHYLIRRRPDKGLLAGMWEFPCKTLLEGQGAKSKERKNLAHAHVDTIFAKPEGNVKYIRHVAELGSVPWLFSHLKLTMHVELFVLSDDAIQATALGKTERWASDSDVESESMGTGMRKCWALVRAAKKS